MRDSLMRDRIADEGSADGSVDKSVVNWLMQVISGKPPVELGINDASAKAAEAVESGPKMVVRREEEQGTAEPLEPGLTITAEDLCGAPVFPVAAEVPPAMNEIFGQDFSSILKDPDAMSDQNGAGNVRRMMGPQLVGGSKPTGASTSKETEVVADVFREGVYFEHTPLSTTTTAEENVHTLKPRPAEAAADEVSVLEIVRDPEKYEAKMRADKAVADEVDWIPTETPAAEGVTARDPFAGIDIAEPLAGQDPTAWNMFVAEAVPEAAVPEVAVAEPEVVEVPALEMGVAEPEVLAEPEIADQPVVEAEPTVVETEIPALPEVAAKAEAEPVVETAAAVTTPEPSAESVPAVSGFDAIWAAAAAQRDTKDGKFSLDEYYREQLLSQPAKAEVEVGKAKGMELKHESLKPESPKHENLMVENLKSENLKPENMEPENLATALKTLAQLGSVLPLAARMAPMFEGNGAGEPATGSNAEVRQEVSGLRLLQYEIKTTVQDHSSHLRRLEDQLTQIRESVEGDSSENSAVIEDMKSTVKLVRVMGIGLGFMLMVLILMVAVMLVHGH